MQTLENALISEIDVSGNHLTNKDILSYLEPFMFASL
jgi:hypothetical protein